MYKRKINGDIIAVRPTKKGGYMVSVWDYSPDNLPINGHYDPVDRTQKPEGHTEGTYLICVDGGYTTITPLYNNDRKEHMQ